MGCLQRDAGLLTGINTALLYFSFFRCAVWMRVWWAKLSVHPTARELFDLFREVDNHPPPARAPAYPPACTPRGKNETQVKTDDSFTFARAIKRLRQAIEALGDVTGGGAATDGTADEPVGEGGAVSLSLERKTAVILIMKEAFRSYHLAWARSSIEPAFKAREGSLFLSFRRCRTTWAGGGLPVCCCVFLLASKQRLSLPPEKDEETNAFSRSPYSSSLRPTGPWCVCSSHTAV